MRIVFTLVFMVFTFHVQAQSASLDSVPAVIRHLLNYSGEIPHIGTVNLTDLIPPGLIQEQQRVYNQYLVKTSKNLYAGVGATGILFELKDSAGHLKFHRVDKTHHYGNSFGALYFTLNDTIYSLGGYGFWRYNGQLRYFNPKDGEWSLRTLNKEVPLARPTGWLDKTKKQLYIYGVYPQNQGLKATEDDQAKGALSKLYRLDIQEGNWHEMGEMITMFNQAADNIYYKDAAFHLGYRNFNSNSLGHFLSINRDLVYIDDFLENERLRPKEHFYKKYTSFGSKDGKIFYCVDSVLYASGHDLNKLDSITLTASDFKRTNEKVFVPQEHKRGVENESNLYVTGWVMAGTLLGFLLFPLFSKLKKRRLIAASSILQNQEPLWREQVVNITDSATSTFDELETELIRFIIDRCKLNTTVSVGDVNRMLGLAGKNEPVQKKNRSEKINSINEKWMHLTDKTTPLIYRKRSEFDKRIFEYYINSDDFVAVQERL